MEFKDNFEKSLVAWIDEVDKQGKKDKAFQKDVDSFKRKNGLY